MLMSRKAMGDAGSRGNMAKFKYLRTAPTNKIAPFSS
jgi:hypothetical protein